MNKQEQDKLWAELSEESKERIRKDYNNSIQNLPIEGNKRGEIYSYECLFGEHNLKPTLTYEDVIKELFKNGAWQVAGREYPREFVFNEDANDHYFLNCASEEQGQKLLAINNILNVAKFLNKNEDGSDWVPDFNNKDEKNNKIWSLGIDEDDDKIRPYIVDLFGARSEFVYFRTKEITQRAIQILGEDVVRTALIPEY